MRGRRRLERWRGLAASLGVVAAAGALGGCWGTSDLAPDTTAPSVEARPGAGPYAAVQYVTLAADEIATIEYTLDGSAPATGAPGTYRGTNPVFWIRIGDGETTLRFRAIDAAGNVSSLWTATYHVDSRPPVLQRLSPAPGPVGLLGEAVITWATSEPASWTAELEADQNAGAWSTLGSGQASPEAPVTLRLGRTELQAGPGTLRVTAVDGAGHAGTLLTRVAPAASELVFTSSTRQGQPALQVSADGRRAYFTGGQAIVAVDVDPASPGHGTARWSRAGLWYPRGLALEPGGARLWIHEEPDPGLGQGTRFVALDPETGAELAAFTDAQPRTTYALVASGEGRLYAQVWSEGLVEFDADPASPTFGAALAAWPALDGTGVLLPSPDRRLLLDLGYPEGKRAGLLVSDPSDPDHGLVVGTLGAQLPPWQNAAAWEADGQSIVLAGCLVYGDCGLQRYDVATDQLGPRTTSQEFYGLALTPDGQALLGTVLGPGLQAFDPLTLEQRATLRLDDLLSYAYLVAVAPDGASALVLGHGPDLVDRLVRVPLR